MWLWIPTVAIAAILAIWIRSMRQTQRPTARRKRGSVHPNQCGLAAVMTSFPYAREEMAGGPYPQLSICRKHRMGGDAERAWSPATRG